MKRSVFILIQSLAGLKFVAFASAPITSLPVTECDALIVSPKVFVTNCNLQFWANYNREDECFLTSDNKHSTKSPNLILNESVGTLPDSDYFKIIRLVSQNRKTYYKNKSYLSNLIKTLIKVPP